MRLESAASKRQIQAVSTKVIERQLADLEKRVAELETGVSCNSRNGWKQIIGTSKGQRLDREAAKLGAQWRAKANRRK